MFLYGHWHPLAIPLWFWGHTLPLLFASPTIYWYKRDITRWVVSGVEIMRFATVFYFLIIWVDLSVFTFDTSPLSGWGCLFFNRRAHPLQNIGLGRGSDVGDKKGTIGPISAEHIVIWGCRRAFYSVVRGVFLFHWHPCISLSVCFKNPVYE